MTTSDLGCACEPFEAAVRAGFIDHREDRWFLGDRQATSSGWSSVYGPEIRHCPFCGTKLDEPAVPQRTRVR